MSTEKENSNTTELETANVELAGDLLRKKREKLGLSQKEIADRLRLRVAIIESIDKNNYDFDQVATFTRGYLRSYAKAVDLDEKEVLAALNDANEVQHIEQEMQSFSRKTKREKHDSRIMKLTWAIFAIIIGISSVWWYQNQQDTLTETVDEVIIERAITDEPASPVISREEDVTINEDLVAPVTLSIESEIEPVDGAESTNSEPAAFVENEVTIQPVVVETVSTQDDQTAESALNELVMNFTADCWVQVKDATGSTLATGVKKAGREVNLAGEPPFSIILGAPEGVSLTFAGEPVDLSGYTSGKVARFTLP